MSRELHSLLRQAARVLVLSHQQPDGDALGSTLGLLHLLEGQGKRVWAYSRGPLPAEYLFLPGRERISADLPAAAEIDLAVLLDCHQPQRIGRAAGEFLAGLAAPSVVIDHHQGAVNFGRAAWVDPEFAATSEMLAILAGEMGWAMTAQAATCLFVGLQTDTGSFRYANTTPRCLRVAADLVQAGAPVWPISQKVYATRPQRLRLMGRIMEGLSLEQGGRLAVGQVTQADLAAARAEAPDLEQAVETLRLIPGVDTAMLLRETPEGGVKVSLRSRGGVDVSQVAIALGGGGHKNAAGVTLAGTLPAVRAQVGRLLAQRMGA